MRSTTRSRAFSTIGYSRRMVWRHLARLAAVACALAVVSAQELKGLDFILDTYVRDGLVYYRALKLERGRLDAFITSLGSASVDNQPAPARAAFWINAYNALVLRT